MIYLDIMFTHVTRKLGHSQIRVLQIHFAIIIAVGGLDMCFKINLCAF